MHLRSRIPRSGNRDSGGSRPRVLAVPGLVGAGALVLLLGALSGLDCPARAAPSPGETGVPAHARVACGSCHVVSGGPELAVAASRTCRGCHAEEETPHRFVDAGDPNCGNCHRFHDPSRVRLGAGGSSAISSLTGLAGSVQCPVCHRPGASASAIASAHRPAAGWYHEHAEELRTATVSEACLRCHDRSANPPGDASRPPRFSRHATHPFGSTYRARPGDAFDLRPVPDPRLRLVDGRIECTTCHDLRSRSDDLLAGYEDPSRLCTGCHVRRGGDDGLRVVSR